LKQIGFPAFIVQRRILNILFRYLPLSTVIKLAGYLEPLSIKNPTIISFGRECLGLQGDELNSWYRSAWAGMITCHATRVHRHNRDREDEVRRILLPVDWQPIENLLADSKGLILVGAHIGPKAVVRCVLSQKGEKVLSITGRSLSQRPRFDIPEFDRALLVKKILARAFFHLRKGGIVYAAPDGRHGDSFRETDFIGRKVMMAQGIPELARLSGAPVLPINAAWEKGRIGIHYGPRIQPSSDNPERWNKEWIMEYLKWLEGWLRSSPENCRMSGGLWRIDGGVFQ